MKTFMHPRLTALLIAFFSVSSMLANDYITRSANGDLIFYVTYDAPQAYVEVFSKQNGIQNVAENIVGSQEDNGDGTFTYSLTRSGAGYSDNDVIVVRFYSFGAGQTGVFLPGPDANTWSAPYNFGSISVEVCKSTVIQSGSFTNFVNVYNDGSILFRLKSYEELDYLEVFARINGLQNLAVNMSTTGYPVHGGAFYYDYTTPAGYFTDGDVLEFRFYTYFGTSGQIFIPGPTAGEWNDQIRWANYCGGNDAIFVASGGDDSNAGTIDSPVRSIQVGIDLAEALDYNEVRVSHGRYYESEISMADGVSLLGGYSYDYAERDFERWHTTIDAYTIGSGYGCYSQRAIGAVDITSPTVLEGFTITGGTHCGYYSPIGGGGLLILRTNDNFIVRHNRIFGNEVFGHPLYARGGNIFMWQSAAKILNNEIVYGYSPVQGADIWATEGYEGQFAEIAYNTFTSTYGTVVDPNYDFHDNQYLNLKKAFDHTPKITIDAEIEMNHTAEAIDIYDLNGRLVTTVTDMDQLNSNIVNPGIYVTVSQTGSGVVRNKVMVK